MTDPSVLAKPLPLGKAPARKGAVKFKLTDYAKLSKLPKPPRSFGHLALQKQPWGDLGNSQYGCCAWAGAAHETMGWAAEAGQSVKFTTDGVLSDYAAQTGFDITQTDDKGNNPTDNGTDMQEAASYRRKVGIVDAEGRRHKIDAYLALKAGDISQLLVATYLFGFVSFGCRFPASADDQFTRRQIWKPVHRSPIRGGHYLADGAFNGINFRMITWGAEVRISPEWIEEYNDESIVAISLERLTNNRSLDGFDIGGLRESLAALPSS